MLDRDHDSGLKRLKFGGPPLDLKFLGLLDLSQKKRGLFTADGDLVPSGDRLSFSRSCLIFGRNRGPSSEDRCPDRNHHAEQ